MFVFEEYVGNSSGSKKQHLYRSFNFSRTMISWYFVLTDGIVWLICCKQPNGKEISDYFNKKYGKYPTKGWTNISLKEDD